MHEVLITQQFRSDLDSLDKVIQKRVITAILQISIDHYHPSLNSKKQTSIPSRSIWRSRVTDNFRLLWEWYEGHIRLWRVGKHKFIDSINYVRGHPKHEQRFNVQNETDNREIEFADLVADPDQPQPFGHVPDNILRLFGVSDEQLASVKELDNPEKIFDLPIPEYVQFTLYGVLEQRDDWTVSDLLDTRQLLYRTSVDQLEGYCEGKIKQLLLNLSEEQRSLVKINASGPVLIKGVAGSGKTTIGLYRANYLANKIEERRRLLGEETSILLLTYTQTLTKALEQLYIELYGVLPRTITVQAYKEWMLTLLRENGFWPAEANGGKRKEIICKTLKDVATLYPHDNVVTARPYRYILAEIDQVIRARGLATLEEYQAIERVGRGIGLDRRRHRPIMWEVYQRYQREIDRQNLFDWADLSRLVQIHCSKLPEYDVVIIDEAQDLPPSDLHLATQLLPNYGELRSLTLLADPAQSIYYRGIPWREAGINIQGRTRTLATNYRNTRQILSAAQNVIDHCEDLKSESEYIPPTSTNRLGAKPIVVQYSTPEESNRFLAEEIIALCRDQHYRLGDIAVLSRSKQLLTKHIAPYLRNQHIQCRFHRDSEFHILENEVKLITMHSAKGLEFPVVIMIGLDDQYMPVIDHKSDTPDEDELQERKLFYVSMTRAATRLYLLHPQRNRSRFIRNLDESTITQRRC